MVRSQNWVGPSPDTALALELIITVRTSARHSYIFNDNESDPKSDPLVLDASGNPTGAARTRAAVPKLVKLRARDDTGTPLAKGGSHVFIQVEELCLVTSNFRCDRVPHTQDVLNGTMYYRMDDHDDGTYSTTIN